MHKYEGNNPALTNAKELRGRGDDFEILDDHIKNHRSVMVMGAEGVGKSSLLNCCVNRQYRSQMARERNILIHVTDFPTDRDANGVYQYLAEGVFSAVDALDQEATKETYETLRGKCIQKMAESTDAAVRFELVCEAIKNYDYFIMLVIDGFERFVSSPHVTIKHHDLMNNLIAKNLGFVVATNFDFNQDSLPKGISGSYLLQKFSGNEMCLKGLSEAACAELLDPGDFSPEELHQLWILSGGIPTILRNAAKHTYEAKQSGAIDWRDVFQKTYADAAWLMSQWCKLLSKNQAQVLKTLTTAASKTGVSFEDGVLKSAAEELVKRGLLTNPIEADTLRTIPGLVKFNTPLFKKYCEEHEPQGKRIVPGETEESGGTPPSGYEEMDEKRLLELYSAFAEEHGYPRPVSFREPMSDELLNEYQLTREEFDSFDEKVREFINVGILVDQTFLGVDLKDHSSAFVDFGKALEMHLNYTILPILKQIVPALDVQGRCLSDADHLMIGQFTYILRWRGRVAPFTATAGDFCMTHGLKAFPQTFWDAIKKQMSDVDTEDKTRKERAETIRNDIAHTKFVSEDRGLALLKMMFFGEKSLFNRCQHLHDEAVKQGLI